LDTVQVKYSANVGNTLLQITVLNSTAINLYIKNPQKVVSDSYMCLMSNETVCMNVVSVGTKPQPVTDFECVGYNFENLTCSWTPPQNYVKTDYNLTFSLEGRRAVRYNCPSLKYPDLNGGDKRMSCFWNISTTPHYRQVHEKFFFNLTITNKFGTNQITKMWHHFSHVLPGPPENLKVLSKTPSSIFLSWMIPQSMQTFPVGVHHRIYYQCEYGEKQWHFGGMIRKVQHPAKEVTFNLTDLKYAHALCDIRVSLRSAEAQSDDESMWSRNASITERTNSKVPDEPPETNVGSFEIVSFGNSLQYREAYIYWRQISEEQKNGPEFSYVISVEEDPSNEPVELTNTYAKFKNLSISKSYTFSIWSKNINGSSARRSIIYIPKQIDRIKEPLSFTKVELSDGKYELSWEAPKLLPNQYITNYTIFLCNNDRDRPYQCNGMLNWMVVPNNTLTTIKNVEKDKIFQFAISANTLYSSSGMLWAACTVIYNKNMGKMKNVWINTVGSTFIDVGWKLDCSDRIGSVEGYIVYYCPIKSPLHTECKAAQANSTFNGTTVSSGTITNLSPYTTYMLTVAVITKHTTFSQQSDPLYNTTLEAKPSSPPRNLKVYNVTNSTISLVWDPPNAINGILRYYRLEYEHQHRNFQRKIERRTNYTLENLQIYGNYLIQIAACTVECSENSEKLNITTKMGYPSKIRKPTVDRRNDSSITIVWNEPSEPGGKNDHYVVHFKQKHDYKNKTFEYNTTARKYVIENCGDGGKFNTFYVSVKAVNRIEGKNYDGPWSDELENYCDTPYNFIQFVIPVAVIVMLVVFGYGIYKVCLHCKRMRDVEVKLPPGLAPVVTDHNLAPWSTDKHKENNYSHSPPDEELLLVKMSEGRHFSGDSSGCSSGHESVTSSLESGTHISSSSDSGTEHPENYCVLAVDPKADSSYIPVTADANKLQYNPCDVSSESSSPYVMTGEPIKTINPGYVPFNQTEPVGKSSGYVIAGIKNCNGYIPFNQTEPVNRNTGYVVAGIKNCKLD
jgi:cytokine receptor domeless